MPMRVVLLPILQKWSFIFSVIVVVVVVVVVVAVVVVVVVVAVLSELEVKWADCSFYWGNWEAVYRIASTRSFNGSQSEFNYGETFV